MQIVQLKQNNAQVGCHVKSFYQNWEQIAPHPWVLKIVSEGLRLQFQSLPLESGVKITCNFFFSYVKYYGRGGKIASKRCYRICPQRTGGPGLLQYLFHGSQKRWGNKTNFKFKTPQCFSTKGTFQNGDSMVNNSGNATRGLGCVDRSERRLSTHSSSC